MSVVKGHTTLLKYGDDIAAVAWTELGKITEVTPPTVEVEDIDISHMTSPDQVNEYTAGWKEGGESSAVVQFAKAKQASVFALLGVDKGWQVSFSDGSKIVFPGYIKSFGNGADRKGVVTMEITVKVAGKPVFTPGPGD